jgi:hypothetical protein
MAQRELVKPSFGKFFDEVKSTSSENKTDINKLNKQNHKNRKRNAQNETGIQSRRTRKKIRIRLLNLRGLLRIVASGL